jgi:hypothetical protein
VVNRPGDQAADAAPSLQLLDALGQVLAIKLYRLKLSPPPAIPILPCLDHEAMLHEGIAPHIAAYLQDRESGDLHELVVVPRERRVEMDMVSTWGECSDTARDRMAALVGQRFSGHRLTVKGPSWWRGERRVATACRAQVSLRDVLLGGDIPRVKADIDRLQTVGSLMEKESRVASWGVRTLTSPLLAAAGVALYIVLGRLQTRFGEASVTALRYGLISALGAVFLYYGMKAVQLTEMSNRVWKRTAEYNLILNERKRLSDARPR